MSAKQRIGLQSRLPIFYNHSKLLQFNLQCVMYISNKVEEVGRVGRRVSTVGVEVAAEETRQVVRVELVI